MSTGKIAVALVALSIVGLVSYALLSGTGGSGGANQFGNDEGGLGSPGLRTIVTLTVVGGSAFITGFGLRDVIGRAVGRRRNRMKLLQEQKRP